MNKYLVSIYTGNAIGPRGLMNLVAMSNTHSQSHLDEALVIVLRDTDMMKADRMECADILLHTGANPNVYTSAHDPLVCWAAQQNDGPVLDLLLNFGADINGRDPDGCTCLHHCARLGLTDLAGILLASGADPNIRDREGRTALVPALLGDDWEMVELLVVVSDVNLASYDGETPLYTLLLHAGSPLSIIALPRLIEAGADVNTQTSTGDTALFAATRTLHAYYSNTDILRSLLNAGCVVNAQDENGYTALHDVAGPCPEPPTTQSLRLVRDIARELIRAGADINLQDYSGRTPLVKAVINKNTHVAEELLRANCDIRLNGVRPRQLNAFVKTALENDMEDSMDNFLRGSHRMQPHTLEKLFASLSLNLQAKYPASNHNRTSHTPISLLKLCRYVIRRSMPSGHHFYKGLEAMPIPNRLKGFLTFQNEWNYSNYST